ncbi:TAF14B [Symbiodinium sp. KB8]|nr:TAF14B [Symbiodinium sp. KB8]
MAENVASSSMERQHALLASQATKGLAETEELAEAALKEVMALMEDEAHAGAHAPYCPIVYGSIAFKLKPVARKADEAPPVITPATHRWTREICAAQLGRLGLPAAPRFLLALRERLRALSPCRVRSLRHRRAGLTRAFVCYPRAACPAAVFVRGVDGSDISHAIKSVEFKLHETFPEPLRGETSARRFRARERSAAALRSRPGLRSVRDSPPSPLAGEQAAAAFVAGQRLSTAEARCRGPLSPHTTHLYWCVGCPVQLPPRPEHVLIRSVSDEGWGEFEAQITVRFHDDGMLPVRIAHHLRLHPQPGQASTHPPDAPVVHEFYDEVVFNHPERLPDHVAAALRAGPATKAAPHRYAHHFKAEGHTPEADLAQLAAAQAFVAQETARLTERLARADAEAVSLTKDLEALGWSTAKCTRSTMAPTSSDASAGASRR